MTTELFTMADPKEAIARAVARTVKGRLDEARMSLVIAEMAQVSTSCRLLADVACGKRIRARRLRAIRHLNTTVDELRVAIKRAEQL